MSKRRKKTTKKQKSQVVEAKRGAGLEQLFGSRARVKILRLLLGSSEAFYLRELARRTKQHLNSIRREIGNLNRLGLVTGEKGNDRKIYFRINEENVFYPELKALITKSQFLLRSSLAQKIKKIGQIKLLVMTGFFTNSPEAMTDILIVGRVNRRKLKALVRQFEKDFGREINYTVLTSPEFSYRHEITDRFLYSILEGKKVVVIDDLGK